MGTLIFTFILRNEILALFSARYVDKIDTIDDLKTRNLKVLVQNDTTQTWRLRSLNPHNMVPVIWTDFWTVDTKAKILGGTHVLVSTEDKLEFIALDPKYPFRISEEKMDMRFGFYLLRQDINRTLHRRVDKW